MPLNEEYSFVTSATLLISAVLLYFIMNMGNKIQPVSRAYFSSRTNDHQSSTEPNQGKLDATYDEDSPIMDTNENYPIEQQLSESDILNDDNHLESTVSSRKVSNRREATIDKEDLVRIVCISDTHNGHHHQDFNKRLRGIEADILVHAGDFGDRGTREEREDFWKWLQTLDNFQYKLFISGNMDGIGLDQKSIKKRDQFPDNNSDVIYLQNQPQSILGVNFYGCPYTPKFYGGFQYDRNSKEARTLWNQIPTDCDVLISHGPPAGILDRSSRGSSVGCEDLAHTINQRASIKAVIFGHVHHSYGHQNIDGKYFVNAAQFNGIHESDTKNKIIELVFNRKTKTIVDVQKH